jgi:hypothetical protein
VRISRRLNRRERWSAALPESDRQSDGVPAGRGPGHVLHRRCRFPRRQPELVSLSTCRAPGTPRRSSGPPSPTSISLDPTVRADAARLRAQCRRAKEDLSRDTEATILPLRHPDRGSVDPPGVRGGDPASLMGTVGSLRRALRSARGHPLTQCP